MQNKRNFFFALVPLLLVAFMFTGCEKIKARKCGECPDFKRKKRKKPKRRSMMNMTIPELDLDESVALIRV